MRASIPVMTALAIAAARPAAAAEFIPGWKLDSVWSSNVFRTVDENQFGETIPKEDDFSFRTGPDLRLREMQGDLTYDLKYELRYEEFVRLNGISEFDHYVNARADWNITNRTTFSVGNQFIDSASLNGIFQADPTTGESIVRAARQRIVTNNAYTSTRHRLGPLWELTVSGDHQIFDYEESDAPDSSSFSGNVQLTRGITPRLVAGFGGTVQRQQFEQGDVSGEDSGTTFFQASGILNYQFSRTLRISISAGPALSMPDDLDPTDVEVFADQPFDIATCPTDANGTPVIPLGQAERFQVRGRRCQQLFVDGSLIGQAPGTVWFPFVSQNRVAIVNESDTGVENTLTYFARIGIDKQWRVVRASAGYSRSASSGSGLGTSTLIDTLSSTVTYTPSPYWTFSLRAIASKQSAVSEANQQLVAVEPTTRTFASFGQVGTTNQVSGAGFPIPGVTNPFALVAGDKIDNPIDVMTYRVELQADRRITRNLVANATGTWYEQTNSGQLQENKRTEFRAVLGVTWTFDPIPL
jgi:hypothetical protein